MSKQEAVQKSDSASKVVDALIKVQGSLKPVKKDQEGGRGKYATLDRVMAEAGPLLRENRLALIQIPCSDGAGGASLITKIIHESGEFIEGKITVPCQKMNDPQAFGAAMTYGRRYSILSMLGIVTEDDDAQSATYTLEDKAKDIFSCQSAQEVEILFKNKLRVHDKKTDEYRAVVAMCKVHKENLIAMGKQYESDALGY